MNLVKKLIKIISKLLTTFLRFAALIKRHRMETSQLICSANQLTGLDDNFGV